MLSKFVNEIIALIMQFYTFIRKFMNVLAHKCLKESKNPINPLHFMMNFPIILLLEENLAIFITEKFIKLTVS
jgi:hypothetical protein